MIKILSKLNRDYLIKSNILNKVHEIKCLSSIVNTKYYYTTENTQQPQGLTIPSRPLNSDKHVFTKVIESKEDFEHVKKILPKQLVPDPPKHESYPTPSGWVPPKYEKCSKLAYSVLRTRYHNFPIYVLEREGGSRKLVKIRNIEGDIWKFDKDLRNYIENCLEKNENKKLTIYSQVNEVQRNVVIKGHYQEYINSFLIECGF